MEHSYEIADARVRAIGGTSAEHLGSFVTWLGSQQYSAGYACIVARHALAFGRWCEGRGIDVEALTDDDIERFQRSRARRRSRRPETRRQERQALTLLLLFLRERGLCAAAASCTTAVDRVATEFAQHLQRNQGLAAAAVDTYTRLTRQFLVWRFGQAEVCLHDLCPSDSIAFVRQESKRMAPPAVKVVAKALRSFLRFCEFRGEVSAGLAASVPSVATWTTTPPIPKAIAAEHAQRAIDSCNRLTAVGLRDRAVLLLLARLGLRACEIIRPTLDDIDWDQAQLRVHGKEVVLSSQTLVESESDLKTLRRIVGNGRFRVEANEWGAVRLLSEAGVPFVAGPTLNVYNPETLDVLAGLGAQRWLPPVEMSRGALTSLLQRAPADMETEVFAYGKLPLAYSARYFTARHYNRPKDDCQFRCLDHPDGLPLSTREGEPFLTLNGIQTQSAGVYNLIGELPALRELGVVCLRLSPQSRHMGRVVDAFQAALAGDTHAADTLTHIMPGPPVDGYWHGRAGLEYGMERAC